MLIEQTYHLTGLEGGILPLLCLAISPICAILYGTVFNRRPPSPWRSGVKTVSIGSLALLAFLKGGEPWLIAALIASALGDYCLAAPGHKRFLTGVGAFALAHGFYVLLFLQAGTHFSSVSPVNIAIILGMIAISGFLLFRILWPHLGTMKLPLTGYFIIIMAMVTTALCLPPAAGSTLIGIGAIAFAFSDMILGFELFRLGANSPIRRFTSPTVWTLYYGAQFILTFGAMQYANVT